MTKQQAIKLDKLVLHMNRSPPDTIFVQMFLLCRFNREIFNSENIIQRRMPGVTKPNWEEGLDFLHPCVFYPVSLCLVVFRVCVFVSCRRIYHSLHWCNSLIPCCHRDVTLLLDWRVVKTELLADKLIHMHMIIIRRSWLCMIISAIRGDCIMYVFSPACFNYMYDFI